MDSKRKPQTSTIEEQLTWELSVPTSIGSVESLTALATFSKETGDFNRRAISSLLCRAMTANGRQCRGRFDGSPSSSYS